MDTIHKRIRERVNALDMSYTELAAQMHLSYKAITDWVYGVHYPRCADIPKLCTVLECSPSYLFGWEDTACQA